MAKRILVVDDDENILNLERTILEQKGFEVTGAGGGAEALRLLEAGSFDLVLLDVMMPEVDGFTVCRKIKDDPRLKDIPVIFLTAKGRRRRPGRGVRVRRGHVHQQALHREQAPHHREYDARVRDEPVLGGLVRPPAKGARMDRILDKARAGHNALERLMNAIPGFKGYREKELRRDADRLQREHLAARLDDNKKALNQLAADATRSGSLDVINDIETARKRLDKVANRVRYADRGYSGFFDPVKVDEPMLDRIYLFDLGLIDGVDAIQAAAQGALQASEVTAAVREITAQVDALDTRLVDREAILSGIR